MVTTESPFECVKPGDETFEASLTMNLVSASFTLMVSSAEFSSLLTLETAHHSCMTGNIYSEDVDSVVEAIKTIWTQENSDITGEEAWWRHQMETFSALLALCMGNSPVTGEFPSQRPVTQSCDVLFDLRLNKRLSKQSRR